MGETIKRQSSELKGRWVGKMPRFFRQLVVLCACIMVTAFGVNQIMVIGVAFIVPYNALADSIMDEISVFVEENIEAEILDEMWEMR